MCNPQPQAARRPDALAKPSHCVEDPSLGTGSQRQHRGGQMRGEEAQKTPKELHTRCGKRGKLRQEKKVSVQ